MHFRLVTLLFFFIFHGSSHAQKVKEWLDQNWEPVPAGREGIYYRTVSKDANGVRHGLVISYYAEDQPRMVGNFKENAFFGPFIYYYPDGRVEAKGSYKDGYRLGFWEEWYPDGKLRQQVNYVEEKLGENQFVVADRIASFWDSTGTQLVKEGNGTWYALYPDGRVFQQGRLADFRKNGEWTEYNPEGQVQRKEFYTERGLEKGTYFGTGGSFAYTADTYQTMPQFAGGQDALAKFLTKHLKYPAAARNRGITGTVFIGFVVEADGKVSDITVLKGIEGGFNEEAVRVMSLLPSWTPARQRGEAVPMRFSLPIRFLQNKPAPRPGTISRMVF